MPTTLSTQERMLLAKQEIKDRITFIQKIWELSDEEMAKILTLITQTYSK